MSHSHLCFQVCTPKEESSAYIEDNEIIIDSSNILLINISVKHQIKCGEWINILIDPESEIAESLKESLKDRPYKIIDKTPFLENITKKLSKPSNNLRPEIDKSISLIRSHNHNCSLDEVAKEISLSSERFRHLFKEELGITFKNYIKWQKIRKAFALKLSNKSMSMTQIAHDSGFSDQAHMSRVIKENFGYTPKFLSSKISR